MHYHYNYLIFVFLFLHISSSHGVTTPRVTITSDKGFIVTAPAQEFRGQKSIRKPTLKIMRSSNGQLSFNGGTTGQTELHLEPVSPRFLINGKEHTGSITVRCVHDGVEVDHCPAQDLVECVASTNNYQVRVLLDAHDIDTEDWKLHASGGFIVYDRDNVKQRMTSNDKTISVRVTEQGIVCNNGHFTADCLVVMPAQQGEPIGYGSQQYQGVFLVMRSKHRALLINRVELEDYVFSVLRTESFPGWPLEVNKVFAIASRSYGIAMIKRSRQTSLPYHIRNTNHHQTYTGIHEFKHLRTAVDETRGMFLSHAGEPIIAMFDVCCGGIIPAHVDGFDFIKAPYLAREYPCTFCRRCKIYDWKATYSYEQFIRFLKPETKRLDTIRDIRIIKRDKAGLIKKVAVHGSKIEVIITGKRLYRLLKEIRSFCFSIHKHQGCIVFTGRGYGHHLGICQWGVREMVRDGYTYREILEFYYPKTDCVRLQ